MSSGVCKRRTTRSFVLAVVPHGISAWTATLLLGVGCASHPTAPPSPPVQDRTAAEIAQLRIDHDQLEQRLASLEAKIQGDGAPRTDPEEPRGAASDAPDPRAPAGEVADTFQPLRPDATRDLKAAVRLLQAKRYDRASDAFSRFLVRYPDDPRAEQAMLGRGECFYASGEFARAAAELEGALARFPNAVHADAALYRLGMSQRKLGQAERAEHTFAQLRARFPSYAAASSNPEK